MCRRVAHAIQCPFKMGFLAGAKGLLQGHPCVNELAEVRSPMCTPACRMASARRCQTRRGQLASNERHSFACAVFPRQRGGLWRLPNDPNAVLSASKGNRQEALPRTSMRSFCSASTATARRSQACASALASVAGSTLSRACTLSAAFANGFSLISFSSSLKRSYTSAAAGPDTSSPFFLRGFRNVTRP